MKDFFDRNKPVMLIAGITLFIFVGIIFISQTKQTTPANLEQIDENLLVTQDSQVLGNKDAPVTLVEFSDFQCPACAAAEPYILKINKEYADQVKIVYRNFPLPQHAFARHAANAALAAAEQNKFWEYAQILFANQEKLADDDLVKYARDLQLDIEKFKLDLANNSSLYTDIVNKDIANGNKAGVNSTPTFFLNGQKLNLQSFADLQKNIENELSKINVNGVEQTSESTK